MLVIPAKGRYGQLQNKPSANIFEGVTSAGVNPWSPPVTLVSGIYFYFPLESIVDDDNDYFENAAAPAAPLTDLFNVNQDVITIVSGFVDNGAHFQNGNVISNLRTLTLASDGGSAEIVNSLNLSYRDFTIRFWAKNDTINDFGYALAIGPSDRFVDASDVEIFHQTISLGGGLSTRHIRVVLTDSIGNTLEASTLDIPSADWIAWHRVVVRYESDTGTLSVQINDETPVEETEAGFSLTSVSRALRIFSASPQWGVQGQTMDEIFVAPDILWTDQQSTDDYGPGDPPAPPPDSPTWPNIPGVGIQDEGGQAIIDEGGDQIIEE